MGRKGERNRREKESRGNQRKSKEDTTSKSGQTNSDQKEFY